MSVPTKRLSLEQIFGLADAFGLAGDCVGLSKDEWNDYWVAPIIVAPSYDCFITKRYDDEVYRDTTSTVVCTDGRLVAGDPYEWVSIGEGGADHQGKFLWWVYFYRANGASYAATEVRGVPERLFIFENSRTFSFARIYTELSAYRRAHRPSILPDRERKFFANEPLRKG